MRHEDWFSQLVGVVLERRFMRFEYGRHDCCVFAAACVDAMTGSRYVEVLGDLYRDSRAAAALVRDRGGLEGCVTSALGQPSKRRIRTGDCVLFRQKSGERTCGIAFGPVVIAPAAIGITFHWRRRVIQHWAI